MSAPHSGCVQSHPSTLSFQKRIRVTLSGTAAASQRRDKVQDSPHTASRTSFVNRILLRLGVVNLPGLPGATYDRQTFPRVWSIYLLKWLAAIYCLLSCMVLTIDCYKYWRISLAIDDDFRPTGYLNDLSLQHRLSRIINSQNILSFEPYLLGHQAFDQATTSAGLWIEDTEDLDLLAAWARVWPGPLSVVMTTTKTISSSGHSRLLRNIYGFKKSLGTSHVCLHLLYVKGHNSSATNLYLNIARIFAPTSRIVLFPAPVAFLPPRDLYHLINTHDTPHPSIITTPSQTMYPFTPLSPILLRRNHSTWCTERHFVGGSRATDWCECIWQIWTESVGKAVKIAIGGVPGEHDHEGGIRERNIIHHRTSTIFRSEYCDIVMRRNQGEAVNWLKYFCAKSVDKTYRP